MSSALHSRRYKSINFCIQSLRIGIGIPIRKQGSSQEEVGKNVLKQLKTNL